MARVVLLTALVLGALSISSHAQYDPPAQEGEPAAEVDANGNAFVPGSLGFDPVEVSVPVGGVVRWTNTDYSVPHTSTEDHGLWRLSGTYGSPGPYQGYGPGESVARAFEAGTHHYYCEVHPDDMKAVVEVPVTLERARHRRARAIWSPTPPDEGLVFDVQRKRNGTWRTVLEGTSARKATFRRGSRHWRMRARLRSADDETKATAWSPVASIGT
jgi:plastocyanin